MERTKSVAINQKNFPDATFRAYVQKKFDKNKNGKKVLRKYANPKSIKFSKSSISVKKDDYIDLRKLLKITPAANVYPVMLSVDKEGIVYHDNDDPIIGLSSVKKGTVTVTSKSGGKTATIQITVK